jgi:hypothetical protein
MQYQANLKHKGPPFPVNLLFKLNDYQPKSNKNELPVPLSTGVFTTNDMVLNMFEKENLLDKPQIVPWNFSQIL